MGKAYRQYEIRLAESIERAIAKTKVTMPQKPVIQVVPQQRAVSGAPNSEIVPISAELVDQKGENRPDGG